MSYSPPTTGIHFQIGFVTFDQGPMPRTIRRYGNQISFTIEYWTDDRIDLVVNVSNLVNYADPRHGAVPIRFIDDPELWNGFYFIRSAQARLLNTYPDADGGMASITITAERVRAAPNAQLEIQRSISERPNDVSYGASNLVLSDYVPDAYWWTATTRPDLADNQYVLDRNGDEATLLYDVSTGESAQSGSFFCTVDPANYYHGAAMVEVDFNGAGTWYPVAGRDIPEESGDLTNYRLTNGLIRVGFNTGNDIVLEGGNRDTTGTPTWDLCPAEFEPRDYTNAVLMNDTTAPLILRNDPECVAIRVFGESRQFVFDISLQRGHRHLELAMYPLDNAGLARGRVTVRSDTTWTDSWTGSGYVHDNTDDANDSRWWIGAPEPWFTATGPLIAYVQESVWPVHFAIGYCSDDRGNTASTNVVDAFNEYMSMRSINQTVVTA